MGRLAALIAKTLLEGNKVVVVRCEQLNISGNFYRYGTPLMLVHQLINIFFAGINLNFCPSYVKDVTLILLEDLSISEHLPEYFGKQLEVRHPNFAL